MKVLAEAERTAPVFVCVWERAHRKYLGTRDPFKNKLKWTNHIFDCHLNSSKLPICGRGQQ